MFFITVNDSIKKYYFTTKKSAILYIIDYLERKGVEYPISTLKKASKTNVGNVDTIKTDNFVFVIEKWFMYRKCIICDNEMSSDISLDCKHNVCLTCLSNLRKNECPICRKELSGSVITDEILCNILQRTEIDEHESRQRDMTMAMAAEIGYNPNELY